MRTSVWTHTGRTMCRTRSVHPLRIAEPASHLDSRTKDELYDRARELGI